MILFDEPDSGPDPVRGAYLNHLRWSPSRRTRGRQPAPEGERSCVRTVQIRMVQVDDGTVSEPTVLRCG